MPEGCLGTDVTPCVCAVSAMYRSPRLLWHGSTILARERATGGDWLSSLMLLPCHTPTQTRMDLWLACAKPGLSEATQKGVLRCWCGAGCANLLTQ